MVRIQSTLRESGKIPETHEPFGKQRVHLVTVGAFHYQRPLHWGREELQDAGPHFGRELSAGEQ